MRETQSKIQFFCSMELRRSFVLNEDDYSKLRENVDSDSYSDGSEAELVVLSHVRAYFDISSKRIIETVPMICDTSLSLNLTSQLQSSFIKELGLVGPSSSENSERFLQEDPDLKEKKQRLRRNAEIINRAEQILASAGSSINRSAP